MKKTMAIILILVFCLSFYGCGDVKTIGGHTYQTYGLINKDDIRNPDIEYRIIIGNIVWSCLLVETVIAPIYFLGFSLYEPVGKKQSNAPIGTIN